MLKKTLKNARNFQCQLAPRVKRGVDGTCIVLRYSGHQITHQTTAMNPTNNNPYAQHTGASMANFQRPFMVQQQFMNPQQLSPQQLQQLNPQQQQLLQQQALQRQLMMQSNGMAYNQQNFVNNSMMGGQNQMMQMMMPQTTQAQGNRIQSPHMSNTTMSQQQQNMYRPQMTQQQLLQQQQQLLNARNATMIGNNQGGDWRATLTQADRSHVIRQL